MRASGGAQNAASGFCGRKDDIGERTAEQISRDGEADQFRLGPRSREDDIGSLDPEEIEETSADAVEPGADARMLAVRG